MNNKVELIRFLQDIDGLGNVRINKIIKKFNSLYEIISEDKKVLLSMFPFIRDNFFQIINDKTLVRNIIEKNKISVYKSLEMGINVIDIDNKDYPHNLKNILDAPPIIYVKGQLSNDSIHIACVGTRKPDSFGTFAAKDIINSYKNKNIVTVAGLAEGIDTVVHTNSLINNIKTYAVVATGLDKVYPIKNRNLFYEIVSNGGAIISEHPIGVDVKKSSLIMRDRIQSGISLSTVVIQTETNGGTMHTARFAHSQGRNLFVFNRRIFVKNEEINEFANDIVNKSVDSGCSYLIANKMGYSIENRTDYMVTYDKNYKFLKQESFI